VTVTVGGEPATCNDTLVSGTASCALTLSTPGPYLLTASYGGDGAHTPSSDTEEHTVFEVSDHVVYLPLIMR
jgi:hypothetical protein